MTTALHHGQAQQHYVVTSLVQSIRHIRSLPSAFGLIVLEHAVLVSCLLLGLIVFVNLLTMLPLMFMALVVVFPTTYMYAIGTVQGSIMLQLDIACREHAPHRLAIWAVQSVFTRS